MGMIYDRLLIVPKSTISKLFGISAMRISLIFAMLLYFGTTNTDTASAMSQRYALY